MNIPKSTQVAVIGAGAMGSGIAQVAATAGHPVLLFDAISGVADRARNSIVTSLQRSRDKGKISAEECDQIIARLSVAMTVGEMGGAGLVIEAIAENLEIKQKLFREVEAVVPPSAILATNTSSISITAIGSALKDPTRLAGFHFFNPAPLMKLVEVVSGAATRSDVMEALTATAKAWGKTAVRVKTAPGFIVNRVARPFYGEALRLLEEGAADAATLDYIYTRSGGFRMGPFELMDMIGHDVNYAVTSTVYADCYSDPRYRPSMAQRELVSAGWLGRKSGRGFYDHQSQTAPEPNIHPTQPAPTAVAVEGDGPGLSAIAENCVANGIPVSYADGDGFIRVGDSALARTDGRSATQRVAEGAPQELVLMDLVPQSGGGRAVVLTKADQASFDSLDRMAGLFQALGMTVIVVDDLPAMVLMRTIALLVDEAADAVQKGIASREDIETAMVTGVNYPSGLLAWGDAIGPSTLVTVLDNVRRASGDSRYRTSQLLRRSALCGAALAPATSPAARR